MIWPFPTRRTPAPPRADLPGDFVVLVDDRVDPRLVVYHTPAGLQAEQYRSFRTNLRAMNPQDGPRTLLFTSAQPREGKSVTAANIALALAECEQLRVALLDADLRAGRLHQLFGLSGAPGLSDVLIDGVPPRKALQPTSHPNLSIMAAGRHIENPGELLGGDYLQELISQLKRTHNYVIFDSPPCLAFADAAQLATIVDGVIVVLALDDTTRQDVQRTLEQLQAVGANVIGTFVIGAPADGDDPFALVDADNAF